MKKLVVAITLFLVLAVNSLAAMLVGKVVHRGGYPAGGVAVRVVVGQWMSGFVQSGANGAFVVDAPAGNGVLEVWVTRDQVFRYPVQIYEPRTDLSPVGIP